MKLFAPLALSAGVLADENCGTLSYTNTKNIYQVWSFGSYPTGYQNYQTDWKATFYSNILHFVYSAKCNAIAASIPNVECAGVTIYDLKNDFLGCNTGKWCTTMNLRAGMEFQINTIVNLECPEGSADLPDDDDVSRMIQSKFGSLEGIDLNFDLDTDISVEDINDAVDDAIDDDGSIDGAPDDFNADEDLSEPEQGPSTETNDENTTITDENGDNVDISGECSGGDCVCEDGYGGAFCTDDVNECENGDNNCLAGETCENTEGSYYCVNATNPECPAGYSGTYPDACVDDDECVNQVCGDNSLCENTQGSYNCVCNSGFEDNGAGCVDVNECSNNPCTNAECVNNLGNYECNCYDNYVKFDFLSQDVCVLSDPYECFDGTNGGCSHFCSTEGCGCPDCWTLLADGKTCVPASQHLHVMCGADKMEMSVDECVYGAGEGVTLALADGVCGASLDQNTGMWNSETSLDGCSTTVTAENDIIQFVNTVTVQSRDSAIVMHSDPEISFTCQYSANVDGVSSSISVTGETHVAEGSTSDGSFEFLLNFVAPDKDGVFSVAQNDTMIVGERVYFEIENSNPITGVSFVVQDCEVSDAHGNSHKVVDGNCMDANTLVQRESPFDSMIAASNARFSYTAFIFANSVDTDSANLELKCNIAACLDADCSNIVNDCNARRRRRAAAPKAQTYKLSTHGRFSDL